MAMEPEAEAMPRDEAEDLQFVVIPGRQHVLCGVKNSVRVVMRIRTPADDGEQDRPPISVACVLDRSGSMRGSKLDFAKRACKKLVKHLSLGDTLHFISYDSDVCTVFQNGDLSDAGKEAMKVQIDQVRAGSTTNLCGGLERAATLLGGSLNFTGNDDSSSSDDSSVDSSFRADTPGTLQNNGIEHSEENDNVDAQVRRIFLFSDGCVNAGITDSYEIRRRVAAWAEQGITTTSFGIGSDFDEPLMRGIAESGKGRYTFLGTAHDIPRLVSKSIHDLLKLYGSEASVDIRGGAHTTVAKVFRGDDDDEGSCDAAASGLLQLGDLHNANERMVLLELESAPPGDTVDGTKFTAAEWFLSFQRNGALVQFSGSIDLVSVKERAALGNESASVQAMFAIRRSSDLDQEIAQYLSCRDQIRARDAKSRQISLLKETLETVRNDPKVYPIDIAALEAVLRRAESVAEQLDGGEDMEIVRRQCVQEMELTRAMSVAGFSDGCDSSDASGSDDGNDRGLAAQPHRLRVLDDMSVSSGSPISSIDNDSDDDDGSTASLGSPRPLANAALLGSPRTLANAGSREPEKAKDMAETCSLVWL